MFGLRTDHQRLRNARDAAALQPEPLAPDGRPELWFGVGVNVPGHGIVSMDWQGTDPDDVRDSLIEWINADDWVTVTASMQGSRSQLTFRTSWVSSFNVGTTGSRRHTEL